MSAVLHYYYVIKDVDSGEYKQEMSSYRCWSTDIYKARTYKTLKKAQQQLCYEKRRVTKVHKIMAMDLGEARDEQG